MLKGRWNLHVISQFRNICGGVIEFSGRTIEGGGPDFSYRGEFDVRDGVISGELKAVDNNGQPQSLFGFPGQFHFYFCGNLLPSGIEFTGYLANNPSIQVKFHCTRID
jgi:hypothetical protein